MSSIVKQQYRAFCDKVIEATVYKKLVNPFYKTQQNLSKISEAQVRFIPLWRFWENIPCGGQLNNQQTNRAKAPLQNGHNTIVNSLPETQLELLAGFDKGGMVLARQAAGTAVTRCFFKNSMQEVKNRFLGHLVFSNHSQHQLLSWPSLLCYWSPCRPWGWKADARSATQCNSSKMCIFKLLARDTFKLP